jgi:hypothetical protein
MREPRCLHKGPRAISVTDFILGSIYDVFNVKFASIDRPMVTASKIHLQDNNGGSEMARPADNVSKDSALEDLQQCSFDWASSKRHNMAFRYEMGSNWYFIISVV